MQFSDVISIAVTKAGKQEALATTLDLSPSALSKRLNGEVGWTEREIVSLLKFIEADICFIKDYQKKVETLKNALKILLEEEV